MSSRTTVFVIASLVVGITFVVTLSIFILLSLSPSPSIIDELLIASTNTIPEARVFFSEYPEGSVQIERSDKRHEDNGMEVVADNSPVFMKYSHEKTYHDGQIEEIVMRVMLNELTGLPTSDIYIECRKSYALANDVTTLGLNGRSTVEVLQTTDCAK